MVMTYEPLNIQEFTRALIEQAADQYKPKKELPRVHVEPAKPEHDVRTVGMVHTYLSER